jgi:hypothetical protein
MQSSDFSVRALSLALPPFLHFWFQRHRQSPLLGLLWSRSQGGQAQTKGFVESFILLQFNHRVMQQPLYPQELKCLGRAYTLFAIKKCDNPFVLTELRWLGLVSSGGQEWLLQRATMRHRGSFIS